MDKLFVRDKIVKSISIEPKFLTNKLDSYILNKIKTKIEGTCIKNGYIKPDSLKIIKRSIGKINCSHFNGNILYHLELSVDLCNPLINTIIDVQVLNNNKMGILAGVPYQENSALNILLPRQYHIDNDEFTSLDIGDIISIKIIGKRFEFGDSQISIIGILNDKDTDKVPEKNKESNNE